MIEPSWLPKLVALVVMLVSPVSRTPVQESGLPNPSAAKHDDPLSRVIERSKSLRSFVAEYRVVAKGEESGSVRIVFKAPDQMRIRVVMHDGTAETVFTDGQMYMRQPDGEGNVVAGNCGINLIPTSVLDRIAESVHAAFPKADVKGLRSDLSPCVRFDASTEETSGKPRFNIQIGVGKSTDTVLQWLPWIRHTGRLVEEKENSLVFELEDEIRLSLRKDSGFIERVQAAWMGEERIPFDLIHLETDGRIDPAEFQPPENHPGATDISNWLKDKMFQSQSDLSKTAALTAVHELFRESDLAWDADAKSALRGVLRTFHAEMLALRYGEWMQKSDSAIDEFCRWYQTAWAQNVAKIQTQMDNLEAQAAQWEDVLKKNLDVSRKAYLSECGVHADSADMDSIWKDAHDIDRDAAGDAFLERIQQPALERFAAKLGLARDGKLDPPVEKDKASGSGRDR